MRTVPNEPLGIPADRYSVEREIGRGGYATVYLARDHRHQRSVAIKVLNQALISDVGLGRFQSEIEMAASLAHPNIVPVFDSGAAGDSLYYVMPLIEGESLRQKLEREGALSVLDTLRIANDMAHALSYAHSHNVVHRDIKPENVLLMQSGGHALIADFGIAKVLSGAGRGKLTITGSAIGTPLYMSPEQSLGMPVDARADIYSFAAVVFEMLTGMPPMPGTAAREVLTDTPTGEVPARMSRPARLPRDIRPVLAKALSGDPSDRHATVDEFFQELTAAHGDAGLLGRLRVRRARGTDSRRRVLIAAGTIVAIAAGAMYAVSIRGAASDTPAGMGVVVFPFRATTAAAAEWREAIPDLIATQLDGTPGVRVADPWSLWLPLRRERGEVARSPDPDEARELARKANACCFVLGSVSQVPGRIDVSVRVYQRSAKEPWHTFTVGGLPDSVGSVVQRASLELIRRLAISKGASGAMVERALPRTPAALKEWLGAREYLRRARFDSADAAITRSLAEDSSYVPSLTDAAGIKSWLQFSRGEQYSGLRALAERAVAVSASSSGRSRLRAQAMLASIQTDGVGVARATSAILAMDPQDYEAWNQLSYSHMVYGWQYGVTLGEIKDAAERVYRMDTTSVTSIVRRVYIAVALNDPADVRAQLDRLRRSDTTAVIVRGTLRGADALLASDADFQTGLRDYSALGTAEWVGVLRMLRLYRADRAEQFAQVTLADVTSPSRPAALGSMVQLLAATSRWRVVDSLRNTNAFAIRPGFENAVDRMTVAAAIGGATSAPRAAQAAQRLSVGMPPDSALTLFEKRNVWHDGWLIGAFNAMYGDTVFAARWAAALATLPSGGSPKEYARALQSDIQSRVAMRRGDRREALVHAHRAYALWDIHSENQLEMMPEPAIRFQLASLLRDAGRADSARALFSSFVPPTTWMGFYTARGALELADLEERSGRHGDAERHYMLAARLLEASDADAAPLRSRAQQGLKRLAD